MRYRLIDEMYEIWIRNEVSKSLNEFYASINYTSAISNNDSSPQSVDDYSDRESLLNSSPEPEKTNLFKSLFRFG